MPVGSDNESAAFEAIFEGHERPEVKNGGLKTKDEKRQKAKGKGQNRFERDIGNRKP
jgi:hypothetical protein